MLPYWEHPSWDFGPVTIHAFGVLLVAAILTGRWLTIRRARSLGLDSARALAFCRWATLGGAAAALLIGPWLTGRAYSSVAALAGGVLAGGLSLWAAGLGFPRSLAYIDAAAFAFPWAWMLFRAGCAWAHDHLGVESQSFLAVAFPDGPRLDLGLLEMLFMAPVGGVLLALGQRRRPPGFHLAVFLLLYGPFRLLLDRLRPERVLRAGLSAEQWGGTLAIVIAVVLLARGRGYPEQPWKTVPR
jgi:phosphatidylglycerol:prolipoprotein diacylglycerol transferase